MNRSEKTIALASAGLILDAVGTFLPWSRISGRSRSGYDTADTFISLGAGALPDAVSWVGRWWYVPAFCAVAMWALAFFRSGPATRALVIAFATLSVAMWWLFIWAGDRYGVLNTELLGPTVSTAGLVVLLAAGLRQRPAAFARSTTAPRGKSGNE